MGGGGGSSGSVSFPTYMESVHKQWLWHDGEDYMSNSIIDVMNAAQAGGSPYFGAEAFDPTTDLGVVNAQINSFRDVVALLSDGTDLDALTSTFLDDSRITALVEAFGDDLDAQLASTVYPRFETGMRDLNAVMSSAFTLGRALIEEGRTRDVAKYAAELRMQFHGELTLKLITTRLELENRLAMMVTESRRIAIVAGKEQVDTNLEIDTHDAVWDLEVYKYGCAVMASIQGAPSVQSKSGPSKGASALGGAASGAAVGTSINPGWGTAIGAVVGGVAGYLSAS